MSAHVTLARRSSTPKVRHSLMLLTLLGVAAASAARAAAPGGHAGAPTALGNSDAVTLRPRWREAPFQRVIVAADATTTAGGPPPVNERVAYSNTLAQTVAGFPGGFSIADDLTLTAAAGCRLRRYLLRVTGRSAPSACGGEPCGPFTVNFSLHTACPSAGGAQIPGTSGEFVAPDDGDYEIEFVVPGDQVVTLPARVWLSVRFNRNNAGVVLGALPLVGFSEDLIDFPGFACNANLGGVPQAPHASYFAEVFTDDKCPTGYPGYFNTRPAADGIAPGTGVTIADDVKLGAEPCLMSALEIGVRNRGFYSVEIRPDNDGVPDGGSTFGEVNLSGTFRRFATAVDAYTPGRVTFDPPVSLPEGKLWVTLKTNNNRAAWILTRRDARIGHTASTYARFGSDGWSLRRSGDLAHGGLHVVVTCAGEAPSGACCDMLQLDEQGESMCREVPAMNCAWPTPGSTARPRWVPGATCDQQPFPFPCGTSACCRPDDTCQNLTRSECEAVEPVDVPRVWDRGEYCAEDAQECPWTACLVREGTCATSHDGVGCSNSFCCDAVCDVDPWCCQIEWDRECIRVADRLCSATPTFDDCFVDEQKQALLIDATGTTVFGNSAAEQPTSDPSFSCRLGAEALCSSGPRAGLACQTSNDCPQGDCRQDLLTDQRVFHTVWFRFRATAESAAVSLCGSDPGLDSVVQVFSVGDDSDASTACATLTSIACKDDSPACSDTQRHGRTCVTELQPGELYYIAVGSKRLEDGGLHKLTLRSPCRVTDRTPINDDIRRAVDLELGVRAPFDLSDATAEDGVDECASPEAPDVWYAFDPTAVGWFTIRAEVMRGDPSALQLATYRATPEMEAGTFTHACGSEGAADDDPNLVTVRVEPDDDFLIRLARTGALPAFGDIVAEPATEPQCRPLSLEQLEPPVGVVDARRPHAPDSIDMLAGVDTFVFSHQTEGELIDALENLSCWTICTSSFNSDVHPPYPIELLLNRIEKVRDVGNGIAEATLIRPVTPGEITKVVHVDVNGRLNVLGPVLALPGDVNADGFVGSEDILDLIDALNLGVCEPPTCPAVWGEFSTDIDRSGAFTATDILDLIDLFNGSGAFQPFLNVDVPTRDIACP